MFINYNKVNNKILIDVRTKEEFDSMNLSKHNVPIINKSEHDIIKKFYPVAIFIILYGFIKNRKNIKKELINISNNKSNVLIIACSQGRLRSPIVYFYAKYLGIDAYILKHGIKNVFGLKTKKLSNLFGFLDI